MVRLAPGSGASFNLEFEFQVGLLIHYSSLFGFGFPDELELARVFCTCEEEVLPVPGNSGHPSYDLYYQFSQTDARCLFPICMTNLSHKQPTLHLLPKITLNTQSKAQATWWQTEIQKPTAQMKSG